MKVKFTILLTIFIAVLGACLTEQGNVTEIRNPEVSETEADSEALTVRTYTSPSNDAVNTHWIETDKGIIIVDAQRLLSEARKALTEIKKSGKPIIGIFITHPHTDHYGGFGVFAEAAPKNTSIFAAAKTIESMKNDNRGFNKARKERHGEDYPTQEQINRFLPNRTIRDGETVELGGLTFRVIEKPESESETAMLLYLPRHEVLFAGDLVNNKVTPAPFEGIENWIRQLREISEQLPNVKTVYIGHGVSGEAQPLVAEQLQYLVLFRDLVKRELERNKRVTPEGQEAIIRELEAKYPDYAGAAALPRRELLTQMIKRVAEQLQKNPAGNERVQTYASPGPLDHSCNTFWIETDEGIVVVDAQWVLSEAENALREIRKSNKPVIGIFITHSHTDHFGGINAFARAYPNAPIFASQTTVEAIRTDAQGFIKNRQQQFGADFSNPVTTPNRILKDGEDIRFGAVTMRVIDQPNNESLATTLLYLPNDEILFTGDLVNNKVIPLVFNGGKDDNVANWIKQLQTISGRYPNLRTIYPGHGAPAEANPLLQAEINYLTIFRRLVADEVAKRGEMTPEGRAAIVMELERRYPDYKSAAGLPKREMLERNIDWVAKEVKK